MGSVCRPPANMPRLTKFIRLTIYQFIDFKEKVLKLTRLGSKERDALLKSQIARENKMFTITLNRRTLSHFIPKDTSLDKMYRRIETRAMLADKIHVDIYEDLEVESEQQID